MVAGEWTVSASGVVDELVRREEEERRRRERWRMREELDMAIMESLTGRSVGSGWCERFWSFLGG